MIGNATEETNFPHKLLLTDEQASNVCNTFAHNPSANINLSKTQTSKMMSEFPDFRSDSCKKLEEAYFRRQKRGKSPPEKRHDITVYGVFH